MGLSNLSGYIKTPWSLLRVYIADNKLVSVDFVDEEPEDDQTLHHPIFVEVQRQIRHYLSNSKSPFKLDVEMRGTEFQKRVWAALNDIPSGTVVTYGELAKKLGTSARALGGACRANPIPIIIPCHRVVSREGMGGYSGAVDGKNIVLKRALLKHEGISL